MPRHPSRYRFWELLLLNNVALGLTPEAIVRATPLVLVPQDRHVRVDRGAEDFLGWARLYIGMRSASRQLRFGRWQLREDQMWPAELAPHAFSVVSENLRGNPSVAVASIWVPVQRRPGRGGLADELVFGPALNPLFAHLQWVALDESGTLLRLVQEDFLPDEVHLRLPARAGLSDPGDPRLWRRVRWPGPDGDGRLNVLMPKSVGAKD